MNVQIEKISESPTTSSLVSIGTTEDLKEEDYDWLWKPFIPFGEVTIIDGDGGEGKTTMVMKLCCMLSNGEFPPPMENGHLQDADRSESPDSDTTKSSDKGVTPITSFYATMEGKMSRDILPLIRINNGNRKHIMYSREDEVHFVLKEEVVRAAIEMTGCRVLICDPFTSFLPPDVHIGNQIGMRNLINMLMGVAQSTGVAIILIAHLSKNQNTRDLYRGYGSTEIRNTARNVLMVATDPKSGRRYFKIVKSNAIGADKNVKVALDLDDDGCLHFSDFTADGNLAGLAALVAQSVTDRCAGRIAELLADGPQMAKYMTKTLNGEGFPNATVYRARKKANVEDYSLDGQKYWRLKE